LPYSVDKSCSRHQPPPGRENRTTGVSGRVKHHLANTIHQMLAWKESLGAANEAIRGKRMDVMIAPCSHAFHTKCLERWLGIKGECPSCRSALPSV
jgi:hypothetical protein